MNIVEITVQHLQIPFTESFSHASADRQRTDSLIVRLTLDDGTRGYGECCPRLYVTGEGCRDAARFIQRIAATIASDVHDFSELRQWVIANEQLIDRHPAAFCGLELALIDAFARRLGLQAEAFFDVEVRSGRRFNYSAVVSGGPLEKSLRMMQAYRSFRFDDFKIKLSGNLELDIDRIEQFIDLSPASRLRLDANNLWSDPLVAASYLQRLPDVFFAVEEPLGSKDFAGLSLLQRLVRKKIILDESFTSRSDLGFLPDDKDRFILNVRISKLGGLIRSKMITGIAERSGIKYIIGAHVGETSILSKAALILGAANGGSLIAREGAAGEYLLSRDICRHSIMFGDLGFYQDDNDIPGIGFEVNEGELDRYVCLAAVDTRENVGAD